MYKLILQDGSVVNNPEIDGLKVEILDNHPNNSVVIHDFSGEGYSNVSIRLSGGSKVEILPPGIDGIRNTVFNLSKGTDEAGGMNKSLYIDSGAEIHGAYFTIKDADNLSVRIGKDVMISDHVNIQATDQHIIIDKVTGDVINDIKKEINIGNHVWIGRGSTILKGVSLPDDSIVGMASVVTKSFTESNSVIAGNPAQLVKMGIDWKRDRLASAHK